MVNKRFQACLLHRYVLHIWSTYLCMYIYPGLVSLWCVPALRDHSRRHWWRLSLSGLYKLKLVLYKLNLQLSWLALRAVKLTWSEWQQAHGAQTHARTQTSTHTHTYTLWKAVWCRSCHGPPRTRWQRPRPNYPINAGLNVHPTDPDRPTPTWSVPSDSSDWTSNIGLEQLRRVYMTSSGPELLGYPQFD